MSQTSPSNEDSANQRRLEITMSVAEQIDCPLFRRGDKMVVRLPEVETASGSICLYALSQALPFLTAAQRAKGDIAAFLPRMRCVSGGPHYAEFNLESRIVVETAESRAAQALRKLELFAGLDRKSLDKVVACLHTDQYFPRSFLIEQGQTTDRIILISRGIAEVVTMETTGFERIKGRLSEGEVYGAATLNKRAASPATLRCLTIVHASVLLARDLVALSKADDVIKEHLQAHGFE